MKKIENNDIICNCAATDMGIGPGAKIIHTSGFGCIGAVFFKGGFGNPAAMVEKPKEDMKNVSYLDQAVA